MRTIRPLARAALVALVLAATSASAQVGKSVTVKDANTATEAEVAAMPHMTPELAKALVAARPFASITALDAFLGAKLTKEQRKLLEQLRDVLPVENEPREKGIFEKVKDYFT